MSCLAIRSWPSGLNKAVWSILAISKSASKFFLFFSHSISTALVYCCSKAFLTTEGTLEVGISLSDNEQPARLSTRIVDANSFMILLFKIYLMIQMTGANRERIGKTGDESQNFDAPHTCRLTSTLTSCRPLKLYATLKP